MEAKIGPAALAKAPRDLKIPMTLPFWWSPPNFDTIVIMHGTTIAVAAK